MTVYHDTVRSFNREVYYTVDIRNFEAEFEDALNFVALVYVTKAKVEFQRAETKKARENILASIKSRIRAENRERRENRASSEIVPHATTDGKCESMEPEICDADYSIQDKRRLPLRAGVLRPPVIIHKAQEIECKQKKAETARKNRSRTEGF